MNKDYILKNLSYLSPEVIADAIIRSIISLEEIIESGILDPKKLERIRTVLLQRMNHSETDSSGFMDDCSMEDSPVVLPLPPGSRKRATDVLHSIPFERVGLGSIRAVVGASATLIDIRRGERQQEECQSSVTLQEDKVYSAVYAPASAELNRWFRVQVHLYSRSDAERSRQRAREMDARTQPMEEKPLMLKVTRGEMVEAEIKFYDDGVQAAPPKRSLKWDGELTTAVFQVRALGPRLSGVAGDVILSKNGALLGEFSFVTDIVSAPMEKKALVLGEARAYKTAFISYAHEDSAIANTVHTLLTDAGYEVFLDRESLAPGDLFNERIMDSIEKSEVFYLLWSKNAAASDYVEKEYMHAYPLAYPPKPERPSLQFRPFFIDQPHADPPEALKQVNFVDLYSK